MPYTERESYYDEGKMILVAGPEAQDLFERYHEVNPGAREFAKDVERLAKSRGWVCSIMGRKMHFPGKRFAYKGAGYLYQSGTAEAIKTKMIQTWRQIRDDNMTTSLLLSVHDELNFSYPDDSTGLDEIDHLRAIMEDFSGPEAPFHMRVPMRVDPGYGDNWFEASCE
jgi:DNA polymerase-1